MRTKTNKNLPKTRLSKMPNLACAVHRLTYNVRFSFLNVNLYSIYDLISGNSDTTCICWADRNHWKNFRTTIHRRSKSNGWLANWSESNHFWILPNTADLWRFAKLCVGNCTKWWVNFIRRKTMHPLLLQDWHAIKLNHLLGINSDAVATWLAFCESIFDNSQLYHYSAS